ncbi:MAG TPA: hypothetical protein EYN66_08385 [Myxococcales bacterium]|nr:hypothetical protein [Myxococcales bacterium]
MLKQRHQPTRQTFIQSLPTIAAFPRSIDDRIRDSWRAVLELAPIERDSLGCDLEIAQNVAEATPEILEGG